MNLTLLSLSVSLRDKIKSVLVPKSLCLRSRCRVTKDQESAAGSSLGCPWSPTVGPSSAVFTPGVHVHVALSGVCHPRSEPSSVDFC